MHLIFPIMYLLKLCKHASAGHCLINRPQDVFEKCTTSFKSAHQSFQLAGLGARPVMPREPLVYSSAIIGMKPQCLTFFDRHDKSEKTSPVHDFFPTILCIPYYQPDLLSQGSCLKPQCVLVNSDKTMISPGKKDPLVSSCR